MSVECQSQSELDINGRETCLLCIRVGVSNLFIFSQPKFNIKLGNNHEMRIIQPLLLKDLLFDFNLCV